MAVSTFAEALQSAFRSGDPAPLLAELAPGAVLWHNDDGIEVDAAAGMRALTGLTALVEGLHVEVVQQGEVADGGFVRFEVRGTVRSSGHPLQARNCTFLALDPASGLVRRIDEYVDGSLVTQLGLGS